MGVFTSASIDWVELGAAFGRWIAKKDPASPETLAFRPASDASGYSNETFLATLGYADGGRKDIIVRAGPGNDAPGFFPSYDMHRQYAVMNALGAQGQVPVPSCRWYDEDESLFGTPFFVMDMVEGDIPKDHPLFTTKGFVFDGSTAQRRTLWDSTVEAIAAVGTTDWQGAGLKFLDWPSSGKSRTHQLLDYWDDYYRWAIGDAAVPKDDGEVAEISRWLREHAPVDDPVGLVWGDSRFGNIIYRDFCPTALLDWEMATINNPLMDLTYFFFHEQLNVAGMSNMADARPRLIGFPSHAETIAHYERLTGREAREARYYWVMNGYKLRVMAERAFRMFQSVSKQSDEQVARHREVYPVIGWTRMAMDSASFPVQPCV